MIGAIIGVLFLVGGLAAAKVAGTPERVGKAYNKLAKFSGAIWVINLTVNAALIFVESFDASWGLADSTCERCPVILEVDGEFPADFSSGSYLAAVKDSKPVSCTDFTGRSVILFSSVAGEDWFIYIRLVLAIFCLGLSVLSILMTDGAASFARAVMLGHSNELTKKKDTKGLGDGPAMFIICFVCMLIIGSVIFMVGYLVFEHTAAWAMAGGLVIAGACMGGAAKLLGGGQGVDIPISQATTMKMLAGDLLLSIMLVQSVLEGFTDENNETMVRYGMQVRFAVAGFSAPFMMGAAFSTVTQSSGLRDTESVSGKIGKILSIIGAVTLFIGYLTMPITESDDYLFRYGDEVLVNDYPSAEPWKDKTQGACNPPFPDAKWGGVAGSGAYISKEVLRSRYCTYFKKSSNYALLPAPALDETHKECVASTMLYKQIQATSASAWESVENPGWKCGCANALDLNPWPEFWQFAGQINMAQSFELIASVSMILEVFVTAGGAIAGLLASRKKSGSDAPRSTTVSPA